MLRAVPPQSICVTCDAIHDLATLGEHPQPATRDTAILNVFSIFTSNKDSFGAFLFGSNDGFDPGSHRRH